MQFPQHLTPESFLASYWQKQALTIPGAHDAIEPALTSGELAWLATQEDVESRLVFTEREGNATRYRVQHGPFENDVLSSLPRRNWTLLVQDVEKHLPDFRALFATVSFIPEWRIDDLMVSFAAPGGSVGPHRDNYDVFLCQGEGSREWHLGDADRWEADTASSELNLVKPFVDPNARMHSTGDVLYLPPGVPHWGIARDFCMTYSIGMRAPNVAELNAGAARLFDSFNETGARSSAAGADRFYSDPDLLEAESLPGMISGAALARVRHLLPQFEKLDDGNVARLLGTVVTDPKAWLEPEGIAEDSVSGLAERLGGAGDLRVHGMAQLAWYGSEAVNLLFANGHVLEVSATVLPVFRSICELRTIDSTLLCANTDTLLRDWLFRRGVLDLAEFDISGF